MNVKKIETGPIMANCYICYDDDKNGFMIDPVYPNGLIEDFIEANNIKLSYILLTHTHFDHVLGLDYFKNKYNLKVYAGKEAELIAKDPSYTLTNMYGDIKIDIDEYLEDGQKLEEFNVVALKTPGHSLDSMSYVVDKDIFSGDTLFKLSVGRSDFQGGNHQELINSIITKLLVYDDDYVVFPGHGEETSIGFERKNNPFL